MTIVNTSYSTLVDAWGDDFNASTKRSKKKTKKDPLCELYSQQYNDTLFRIQIDPNILTRQNIQINTP